MALSLFLLNNLLAIRTRYQYNKHKSLIEDCVVVSS